MNSLFQMSLPSLNSWWSIWTLTQVQEHNRYGHGLPFWYVVVKIYTRKFQDQIVVFLHLLKSWAFNKTPVNYFVVWNPQFLQVITHISHIKQDCFANIKLTQLGVPQNPTHFADSSLAEAWESSPSPNPSAEKHQGQVMWDNSDAFGKKTTSDFAWKTTSYFKFVSIKRSIKLWFKISFKHSVPMIWFLGSELPHFWCRSQFHPSPGWLCRNQCTENEQLIPTAMWKITICRVPSGV